MSRAVAVLAAGLAFLLASPPSSADDGPAVPADVDAWFEDDAAGVVAEAMTGMVTADGEPTFDFSTVTVGGPRELRTWTDDFARGKGGAVTRPLHRWIAPLTVDSRAVGTVTAQRVEGSGEVDLFSIDDDAETAAALTTLAEGVTLVIDERLSIYLTVSKGKVGPLSARSTAEVPAPMSQGDYQKLLRQRYEAEDREIAHADGRTDLAGGGAGVPAQADADGRGSGAVVWSAVGLAMAAGAGAWLLRDRRRRGAAGAAS